MSGSAGTAHSGGDAPPEVGRADTAPAMTRVWDPFVRVFHWSLVGLFVAAWLTADEVQRIHEPTGYAIAGLIAARMVWGLVGSRCARFQDFVYRPGTVLGYLRDTGQGRARRYLGHNPAGGAMVIALLTVLFALSATGYMMSTDAWWGVAWVEDLHEILANAALGLVGLHLAGVLVASLTHRENLVRAMITGWKRR